MIVIDGKNSIAGRVATYAAKKALLGEEVKIVNCDEVYITGSKKYLVAETHRRRVQGTWSKGPFYFRMPDRFLKRLIRGMLPYKTARGMGAYKKIMCYVGVPEVLKNNKMISVDNASTKHVPNLKYTSLRELCKLMGGKI